MRYFLFLLFLLLTVGKVFSQSVVNYEVYRPSVNSDQFNIGASIETALSKGQPSVVIPLFELQGKGYNLPISLVFYGGDVNCETEASTVGLGWSLMAGGCITKTVRDKDDSFITTINDAPWQFQDNYLESMFQSPPPGGFSIESMYPDLMPDEFKYSIPGHQGTLEMVQNNQYQFYQKLFPDESYKLEKTTQGYMIIADDGTKFIFEEAEYKRIYRNEMTTESSAWFLSRVETVKGGTFLFNYADETMIDAHDEYDWNWYGEHQTKRITSIESDFGSVTFTSVRDRMDRSNYDMLGQPISIPSERITQIELKDENNTLVKGFELYNNSYFRNIIEDPRGLMDWSNYRLRLDSIMQYDSLGNKLPPYVFNYSYRFYRAKSCYNQYYNNNSVNSKRGSWTETPFFQVLVDLSMAGEPACRIINYDTPNEFIQGFSTITDYYDGTVDDYFCLDSVRYPSGAFDAFEYESHNYTQIAGNDIQPLVNLKIEGKRLKRRISEDGSGNMQANTVTEYIYRKHNSNYELAGGSSGVLTNPSFHNAALYSFGRIPNGDMGYVANRISSDKPMNSYLGQPVYYREVEEVIKNNSGSTLKRIIHYMQDNLIEPPKNYIYVKSNGGGLDHFTTVPNFIYGKRTGYYWVVNEYNNQNFTYLAYPVGEFCPQSQDGGRPRMEVLIDDNGQVIEKKEYTYAPTVENTRYGYVYLKDENTSPYYTVYNISRSSHRAYRTHVVSISETTYSYRDGHCDSIVTEISYGYRLGRIAGNLMTRQDETIQVFNYFPDELNVSAGSNLSPEAQAVVALQQKNIIGMPLQTIKHLNGISVEGQFNEFTVLSDSLVVPKAFYNLSLNNSFVGNPYVSNGSIIKNSRFYQQERALTYDANLNPSHVESRTSPDRVYVWGYGGRYPVAIIENYTETELNGNYQLSSLLSLLDSYKKIDTQSTSATLKSLNMNIRNCIPKGVLVKTYTYDPYFGLTSEFDYSGVGTIYTYDGFGRLVAQYDDHFNLIENYTYHFGH